jgi:hypothetical protein
LEDAFAVLQQAAEILSDGGGRITVEQGTFPLNSTLHLPDNVSLQGSGFGTVLQVTSACAGGIGLMIEHASNVQVTDLCVDGTGAQSERTTAGVVLDDAGNCEIRGVYVKGFGLYGIWMRNSCFLCKIVGCSVAGNGESNVFVDTMAQGRGGHYVPNLIAHNMIFGGGCGIETCHAIVLNIIGCSVYQSRKHSYYIRDLSNSVLISGCRSFQSAQNAVLIEHSHEVNISSNVFCWHRGNGIELRNVTWGAVNGNEVIDTGVRHDPPMTGIKMHEGTRGVQVTGNTIFNWPEQQPLDIAINEDATCYKNIISSNVVSYYLNKDIVSRGQESAVQSNLTENQAYAPRQASPGQNLK